MTCRSFIRALVNGEDRTADEMALLSIMGVLTFLGLSIYSVAWKGQSFDPQGFGTGLGLAIGAAAAGMGVKARLSEPRDAA